MTTEPVEYESRVGEASYTRGLFAGLTPNVIRMGLVSFFADVSSEMLYPIIPIFLTAVLGASAGVVGLIEGFAEATASLLKTVSGRLSDQSGQRKPYVFLGYTISAVAKPLIGLSARMLGWPLVLFARVFDRFGKGVRVSPRDALLADSVDAKFRGKAFGWHRGMDTMGAVIGPLLALLYLQVSQLTHLGHLFYWAFIPGMLGALIVLIVRDRTTTPAPRAEAPRLRFSEMPPAYRAYLIGWGVFALANSSDVFLLLRAKQFVSGDIHSLAGITFSTLLYVAYNIVYAAASPVLGHLSDRLGRQRVLIGGLLIFALVYLGFAFAQAPWQLWALFSIYGLYIAATDGVGKALAVDLAPKDLRASAIGLLGTVSGLAALLASLVAGQLWDHVGPWAAFTFGAVGALAGALLLTRVHTPPVREPSGER